MCHIMGHYVYSRFMTIPIKSISFPVCNHTKYRRVQGGEYLYSTLYHFLLFPFIPPLSFFHWCIQSIIHHNLTLKHVLVKAFTPRLITLSSTCFTVKWIIDHEYLLKALCCIPTLWGASLSVSMVHRLMAKLQISIFHMHQGSKLTNHLMPCIRMGDNLERGLCINACLVWRWGELVLIALFACYQERFIRRLLKLLVNVSSHVRIQRLNKEYASRHTNIPVHCACLILNGFQFFYYAQPDLAVGCTVV